MRKDIKTQAAEVLAKAEEKGVSTNFFFVTTFKRYQVQMATLSELEEGIKEYGTTVKKEYVKGRENICINPAITEYNKTATAANGTVMTLIKIVNSLSEENTVGTSLADKMEELLSDG